LGHNNIYYRKNRYAIKNFPMATTINAVHNYWGYSTVDNSFFWDPTKIYYDPCDTTANDYGAPGFTPGFNKIAVSEIDIIMNYFRSGSELAKSGDWESAINCYKTILSITDLPQWRRKAIKRIIRVSNRNNLDYNDVRIIINNELITATGNYKAVLDYLFCNLIAREALREKDQEIRRSKYEAAIDAFSTRAEQYSSTYMEVEMLCRIATLYGDHLHDKDSAKLYADRAASLDPTYGCLFDAYHSAGIKYNVPDIDKPSDGEEPQPEPEKPASEEIQEYVTINPNPSNPRTTINYSIKIPSHVKLVVYSITGQKVATLIDSHMSAGSHSVIFDGSDLGNGIYLYRLKSKGFTKTGKMLLMK